MQDYYASDPTNPWHFFRPRGGHASLGDPSEHQAVNFMFFGRGGQALWGQQCGVATAGMIFLGMLESGSSDAYISDYNKHFENGKYPSAWTLEVYQTLKAANNHYSNWGDTISVNALSRGSFMCHGIRELCRQYDPSIGGLCAQASIMTAVEFIFKYLNNKRAGGPAVPSELAGFQTTTGTSCTVSGCHSPIAGFAKSDCRKCHK